MAYKVDPVTGQLSEYIFEIGGILALRNFTARTIGERLIIESATNANFVILDAFVGEVQIDGVVYDDPIAAQEALQRLVFNPNVPVIMTLQQQQMLLGALQKGSYSGTASELKQHLETLINNKVTQEPGKGLISDSEKTDIAENKKKRVIDFTITGDVDKIFTLIYNDGSTKAKNFTDIVGQSGADVMLNSLNFNKDTGVLTGVRSDGRQITADQNGRWALLNHTHAWNDITGKPATFPPSPHTHEVNWNDVQNKPDLSQLGAKPVIKVTVDTARTISVKVGTTTAGNYVPKEGDELSVEFKKGQTANNVTLNIDNSGEKKIVIGGAIANARTLLVTDHKLEYKKMVRLWYDGENYQLTGSTYNSTYEVIHTTRLEDVQNQQPHLVSGKILAWVRNWANIIGKPFKLIGNVLNAVNPTNESEFINIKAKGFKIDGGTNNDVLLADGGKESIDNFFTFINSNPEYYIHNQYINDFMAKKSGMYGIQYPGSHSELLLNFNIKEGSTSALQIWCNYQHNARLKVRKQVDNNRTSGAWRELAYYDDIPFQGGDVTGNDWTANLIESKNTIFLKGGGNKTIRLHQLENHTIMSFKKCYDSGTITFVCQGKTIVMRGADAFNGADGSNAVVSIVDNKCYIDINNYE